MPERHQAAKAVIKACQSFKAGNLMMYILTAILVIELVSEN